jgi:hypothetical protein
MSNGTLVIFGVLCAIFVALLGTTQLLVHFGASSADLAPIRALSIAVGIALASILTKFTK